MNNELVKNFILGVGITNANYDDILEYILKTAQKKEENYFVVTPNPEILVYATKHKDFKNILNRAKLALNDGVGVLLAGWLLNKPFKSRVTGTDLVEKLCQRVSDWPITVGFLGGRGRVAEDTAECLIKKYPGLKVSFAESGEEVSQSGRLLKYPRSLKSLNCDILFVAYGFPKQEEWMAENIGKVPVKVMIGVGGAFDYISGRIPRAPQLVRSVGLEWLFRVIVEPWRIKRQLALIEFIWVVLKEKLTF